MPSVTRKYRLAEKEIVRHQDAGEADDDVVETIRRRRQRQAAVVADLPVTWVMQVGCVLDRAFRKSGGQPVEHALPLRVALSGRVDRCLFALMFMAYPVTRALVPNTDWVMAIDDGDELLDGV